MIKVTYFKGDQHNVKDGEVFEYSSLEEMSEHFKSPVKGDKHIGYFVRGECSPMHRKDSSIADSCLVVIDADSGRKGGNASSPLVVHEALKSLGYSHFIYTSHSHKGAEKNKFRVVLEAERDMVKAELKPTVGMLMQDLWSSDVDIGLVKEMGTWSQPWFIPSRDDPEDGIFEFYGWFQGDRVGVMREEITLPGFQDGQQSTSVSVFNDSRSWAERVVEVINCQSFHPNIRDISYGMIKDGMEPKMVTGLIQGIMLVNKPEDEQRRIDWQKRYDDIERIVKGASERIEGEKKREEFSLDGLFEDYEEKKNVIPTPPGLLGVLVDDAYNMALFRYREVAFVSAIGVIAAICGRKFNVVCPEPTGLNVYMTLLADSGVGKDSIIKFMSHVFYNAISDVGTVSSSFFSSIDYTGPKPLMDDLRDARSKLVLTNEAGLSAQQKSGNREGLKAAMLKLYSRSHSAGISDEGGYSKKEDRYGALKSPALSVICESTPENLLESFRQQGAIDNGQLARQSVFRVRGDIPYPADNIQRVLTHDCTKKLKHLASKAAAVQALDDPNVHEMYAENDEVFAMIAAHHRMCIDMRNKHRLTDKLKEVMWSRAHVKALRYAGIACVFNREEAKIFREEWEWATRMVDYEMACVDSCFSGGGLQGDPLDDVARRVAGPVIKKLIAGKYPNFVLDKIDSSKNIFVKTGLFQVLKNNKEIAKFNDDPAIKSKPVSGLNKILNHMIENGYIVETKEARSSRGVCFMLTAEFAVWGGL